VHKLGRNGLIGHHDPRVAVGALLAVGLREGTLRYAIRFVVVLCCAFAGLPAEARRVALVIGNAAYRQGPLANPLNDAAAVADALEKQLRFDKVLFRKNLGAEAFRAALREMSREAIGAEFGVIYFAGHGIEVSGRNYLIPTDAALAAAHDVDLEAIALDTVLSQLDGVKKLKLVILDACRNNPFSVAGAKRNVTRGLARIEPEGNTLVAYAAKDGTTADDGKGRHSPFTGALLKRIATPGLDVRRLFGYVSDDVLVATNRVQEPYVYGRLGGEEIFLLQALNPPAAAAPAVAPARASEAAEAWAAVKDSTSAAQLEVIVTRFKGTVYADLAQARIDDLRRQAEKAQAEKAQAEKAQAEKAQAEKAQAEKKVAFAAPPAPALPAPSGGGRRWEPNKSVTLVVPAGTGSGPDQTARLIQGIVAKHNAMKQPLIVVNLAGGAGAEGLLKLKSSAGDPHSIMVAASNLFTVPYAIGLPFKWRDVTPVAMLALDEFVLWVPADAPYRTAKGYIDAVRAGGSFRMGGTGVKQEDQIITSALDAQAAPGRLTYVPFAGGSTVAAQLAGRNLDSSVSNPAEALSQWQAGAVRPLCMFGTARSPHTRKVTSTMAWSDIPTCREAGLGVEYQMQRGFFLPPGVQPEHVAFYVDLLGRVAATEDWRSFAEGAALNQTMMAGTQFKAWLEANDRLHYDVMKRAGLLAPGQ
jgi:putative tricarboxylic transport membrane protein